MGREKIENTLAKIHIFDFETDPFKANRIPRPFCVGWTDGRDIETHWNSKDADDVVFALIDAIEESPEGSIWYAHNGGKFDFHYLIPFADEGEIRCIGSRVVEMHIKGRMLRDSYALIPVPLAAYKKTEIDYNIMEPEVREKHRREILSYLEDDCRDLYELVTGFVKEFGLHLTMAGAAIKELQKYYPYERLTGDKDDETIRQYYYGGRVQCFEKGVMEGEWKIYDVNSMYPSVMRDIEHPISATINSVFGKGATTMLERADFAEIRATSQGALPWRNPDTGSLDFPHRTGWFKATGHEIRMGLETNTLKIHEARRAYRGRKHTTFAQFVDHFYNARIEAKLNDEHLLQLFYKLILNSAYGKFAQNPELFREFLVTYDTALSMNDGWCLEHIFPDNKTCIYSRKPEKLARHARMNVSTAASITGAARAVMLKGLSNAVRPIYCDTDSIVCQDFLGDIDPSRLGCWDHEASGALMAIAGKKMYCLLDANGDKVKKACKGVNLPVEQIVNVAKGSVVTHENIAPTFSILRDPKFIKRRIRMT